MSIRATTDWKPTNYMPSTECHSKFMQSWNSFPNLGQSLPRIQTGFVHNYSMTHACILGNDCPQFGSVLCMRAIDRTARHWHSLKNSPVQLIRSYRKLVTSIQVVYSIQAYEYTSTPYTVCCNNVHIVETHGYMQEYRWERAPAFKRGTVVTVGLCCLFEQTYRCYVTLLNSQHMRPAVCNNVDISWP